MGSAEKVCEVRIPLEKAKAMKPNIPFVHEKSIEYR